MRFTLEASAIQSGDVHTIYAVFDAPDLHHAHLTAARYERLVNPRQQFEFVIHAGDQRRNPVMRWLVGRPTARIVPIRSGVVQMPCDVGV